MRSREPRPGGGKSELQHNSISRSFAPSHATGVLSRSVSLCVRLLLSAYLPVEVGACSRAFLSFFPANCFHLLWFGKSPPDLRGGRRSQSGRRLLARNSVSSQNLGFCLISELIELEGGDK